MKTFLHKVFFLSYFSLLKRLIVKEIFQIILVYFTLLENYVDFITDNTNTEKYECTM